MHKLLRLLISLACWCHLARGEPVDPSRRNSTGILEVDVVFPQNKTYAASPHMPVVFAFRNTGLARFLDSQYTVRLTQLSSEDPHEYVYTQSLSADELAWDDPHFAYNGYEVLRASTKGQWMLTWSLNWTGCLPERRGEDGAPVPVQASSSSVAGGQVVFGINSAFGRDLDIAAELAGISGAAPSGGGVALTVSETLAAPDNTTFGWARCAVVANATEVRDPSPVTIDAAAAESISRGLKSGGNCVSENSRMALHCPQGGAQRVAAGGVASTFLFAAGFGWLAYFVMFSAL